MKDELEEKFKYITNALGGKNRKDKKAEDVDDDDGANESEMQTKNSNNNNNTDFGRQSSKTCHRISRRGSGTSKSVQSRPQSLETNSTVNFDHNELINPMNIIDSEDQPNYSVKKRQSKGHTNSAFENEQEN